MAENERMIIATFPINGPSICGIAWICELGGVSPVWIRVHWSRFKAFVTPASSQIVVVARKKWSFSERDNE
jgi:hypothetical protein